MAPIPIGHDGDHGFEQPLGLLSDCHRRIERFLRAMLLVSRAERGRPPSAAGRHALEQAAEYFRTAARLHTEDEERSLFPRLRGCAGGGDSALAEMVDVLEAEHRGVEAEHARVDTLVRRWLASGRAGLPHRAASELVARLEALEGTYSEHIRLEDEVLFPAARRELAAHQLEELGREMAERRGLAYRGPLARFFSADHDRLQALLTASTTGHGDVRLEPFERLRAGLLRHIAMEEKQLIPRATAARGGRPPAVAELLRIDHSAIAALFVPPPTPAIVAELRATLERHDRCEEQPGGLYDTCDRALGAEASARLVAELARHPAVPLKPFNSGARVARHVQRSVARSWEAWRSWSAGGSDAPGATAQAQPTEGPGVPRSPARRDTGPSAPAPDASQPRRGRPRGAPPADTSHRIASHGQEPLRGARGVPPGANPFLRADGQEPPE